MNIYEINQSLLNLIDEETGEILDYEAFEELTMAREEKVENMALWYLELNAEAAAIKAEEDRLKARRQLAERKAESLKKYLSQIQAGEKFKTPRVSISFRSSEKVEIQDEAEFIKTMMDSGNDAFLKYKIPEVNKTAVKEALKGGATIEGACISKNLNIQIK